MKKYNIPSFVYENTNELMFLCVDDISNFITFLSKKYVDKEIIILGFIKINIIIKDVINLRDKLFFLRYFIYFS